jgi:hypothetical protein
MHVVLMLPARYRQGNFASVVLIHSFNADLYWLFLLATIVNSSILIRVFVRK